MLSTAQKLGEFRESTQYLGEPKQLNAIFDEDGYVFFRGVLQGVEQVKHDFVRILQQQGAVKPGVSEPLWSEASLEQIDDNELYRAPSCAELFENSHNLRIFEQIFGEPVFVFNSPTVRYALPRDTQHVSPPHQDYFFVRINRSFRTFWIPLMDIDEEVGGLAIAPGIHKRGLVNHVEADQVYSYIFRGRKQMGIRLQDVPKPWFTTNYRTGDLLVFHNLMVHWALPNRSDRIRLSIDNRCAPVHAPRTWQAEKSVLEVRQMRRTAQQIATEEGASQELFEAIIIELMGRGLQPGRPEIKALMAELGSGEKFSRTR
jgi:1-deoxypentalenic acid 11beta-hydroxylase